MTIVVLLTACGSAPTPPPGLDGSAQDAAFSLVIHADKASYRTTDPIVVSAELAFVGLAPDITVFAIFPRVVAFRVVQLDGQRKTDPVSDLMCTEQKIGRLTPLHVSFQKSGGFFGEDPDAPFWRAYFADPVLHLPPGTWQIIAVANFSEGASCSPPDHALTATVTIQVLP
jgi:hypothetical protein